MQRGIIAAIIKTYKSYRMIEQQGVRKKLIPPNVHQGEDILTWLLPIVCCVLVMMMTSGRSEKREEPMREAESWYTTQNIEETYASIENETAEWRKKAQETGERSGSFLSRLRGGRTPKPEERFIVQETIAPRLFRLTDAIAGPVYFELTEVEGGGTVVKATYNSSIKRQMAEFKARSPLKIPAAPIGNRCPSCGKPVLPEFILCPYCGEKLMTKESS